MASIGQRFSYWMTLGRGRGWLALALGFVVVALVSILFIWRHFEGPISENTLEQLCVGRNWSQGKGFTTPVVWPGIVGELESSDAKLENSPLLPDVCHAPLYPWIVGSGLCVAQKIQPTLFNVGSSPTQAFAADLWVLVLNLIPFIVLLFMAPFLFEKEARGLGRWLFVILFLSLFAWEQTLRLSGWIVGAVIVLAVFHLMWKWECLEIGNKPIRLRTLPWLIGLSGGFALLSLFHYVGIFVWLTWAIQLGFQRAIVRRWQWILGVSLLLFAVISPWLIRNYELTGYLTGKAWTFSPLDWKLCFEPTASLRLKTFVHQAWNGLVVFAQRDLWQIVSLWGVLSLLSWLHTFRSLKWTVFRRQLTAQMMVLVIVGNFLKSGTEDFALWQTFLPQVFMLGLFFGKLLWDSNTLSRPIARGGILVLSSSIWALPFLLRLAEPGLVPYHYPPYQPNVFNLVRTELVERSPSYALTIADVPAGVAWYSGLSIWAMPKQYAELERMSERGPIAAIVMTPLSIEQPLLKSHYNGTSGMFNSSEMLGIELIKTGKAPLSLSLNRVFVFSSNLIVLYP
jgi:hypothetical protein